MSAVHLTEQNFEQEVLSAKTPAVVDFWAEWCGPCKMMGPVIDEVAQEFTGKVKIGKVNVDEAQNLATQYSVMSIPTLVFFKDGQVVDQTVGVIAKDQLIKRINKLI